MIYEFRTYDLKPGSLPETMKRFGEGYEHRSKYSELAAFWYTEIGSLNRIVHVWPYADAGERARIRTEAGADPYWPPNMGEFLVTMRSEIFTPFPYSSDLKPGKFGPIYEMRSYITKPGYIPETIKRWGAALEGRLKLSPLAAVMYTDVGPLNKFIHLWPYESLEQRQEVRATAVKTGVWPPPGGPADFVAQENCILLPAPFSPMQ